jgi:hypothetical protein
MTKRLDNTYDLIDSRDVIKRIEELTELFSDFPDTCDDANYYNHDNYNYDYNH